MDYMVENRRFSFSYSEVRDKYNEFVEMSDEEFMENLPSALHLAVYICWFKGVSTEWCLRDDGIIHELVHLLDIPDESLTDLKAIRELFKEKLYLAP